MVIGLIVLGLDLLVNIGGFSICAEILGSFTGIWLNPTRSTL